MAKIETTHGTLLGGRVSFRQPAEGYRAAIDPVLLAAAVPARAGDRVFELGLGAGAAALCLLARVPGCTVSGGEIDDGLRDIAISNAADNGFTGRLDVRDAEAAAAGRFDHLMSNPPFWEAGAGTPSPSRTRQTSNHEIQTDLAGWCRQLCSFGKQKASVTIVFPAARLSDLLGALAPFTGGATVLPLWPKSGRGAKRILVQARVGGRGPSRLLPGITLHQDSGEYTAPAEGILRDAAPIIMTA